MKIEVIVPDALAVLVEVEAARAGVSVGGLAVMSMIVYLRKRGVRVPVIDLPEWSGGAGGVAGKRL